MLKINTTKTAMQMRNLFYNSKRNITFDVRDGSPYTTIAPAWSSNENGQYIREILRPTDTVLTVAGSLDNAIDMALFGIKNIYAVDINPLQLPICWLKYQAMINLDNYQEFYDFAIGTSTKALSGITASKILSRAESSEESVFWRKIFSEKSSIEIRLNYLLNEQYILENMERKLLFKYIEREYWPKAKQALKEAVIYITENDIFKADFPKEMFAVIYLSNLHNFTPLKETISNIMNMKQFLKPKGKIILYLIGMKEQWFYSWDKIQRPDFSNVFNLDYVKDEETRFVAKKQILDTMMLYAELKHRFKTLIIPVKTGGGYMFYNTPTDVVMVLQ